MGEEEENIGRRSRRVIYYLEDDVHIRDLTIYALKQAGYEACGFGRAEELFDACKKLAPELILLDIMLPGSDGLEVLRSIRGNSRYAPIPVMMLTAKGTEYDKVIGLNEGADDYLAKPFGMMELIARVGALLRRSARTFASEDDEELNGGALRLSVASHSASANGVPLRLTRKEFDLLRALMSHPGRVLTRNQLLADVWGIDFAGETRTVDVHVQTLRQKIAAADSASAGLIETVRGVGYRFTDAAGN